MYDVKVTATAWVRDAKDSRVIASEDGEHVFLWIGDPSVGVDVITDRQNLYKIRDAINAFEASEKAAVEAAE
jgi:hypothetical protein